MSKIFVFFAFLLYTITISSDIMKTNMSVLSSLKRHNCLSCHNDENMSWQSIAEKYNPEKGVADKKYVSILAYKIRDGVLGMPPSSLHRNESLAIARWILEYNNRERK